MVHGGDTLGMHLTKNFGFVEWARDGSIDASPNWEHGTIPTRTVVGWADKAQLICTIDMIQT